MRPVIKLPSVPVNRVTSPALILQQLFEAVGPYCMYCESPLADDGVSAGRVSVSSERVTITVGNSRISYSAGVAPYTFAREWVNTELACAPCRCAKADQLGSQIAFSQLAQSNAQRFAHIAKRAGSGTRLESDERDDLYLAALSAWVWPDLATDNEGRPVTAGDPTWDLFAHVHERVSQVALAAEGLVRLSTEEAQTRWAQEERPLVWVVPDKDGIQRVAATDASIDASTVLARVKATIAGLNLNYHNPTDPRASDRRVERRTGAYAAAGEAISALEATVTRLRRDAARGQAADIDVEHPDFERLAEFVRSALRSTGFWTTWAKRLHRVLADPGIGPWSRYSSEARRRVLYKLVVQYEYDGRRRTPPLSGYHPDDDIIPRLVLAGTDAERLPF